MRSWLTYTAARLGLFVAAFGVVYLFGARSWIALALAWLISGLASYVLLSKMRDQLSTQAVERVERRKGVNVGDRLSGGAAREDEIQDALEAEAARAAQEAQEADAAREGDADADARESADGDADRAGKAEKAGTPEKDGTSGTSEIPEKAEEAEEAEGASAGTKES